MNRTNLNQTDIKAVGWTTCIIFTSGLISNALLLLPFARSRSLLTPFNVYILNLAVGNILRLISVFPYDIYAYIEGKRIYPGHSCNFTIFSTLFFTGILLNLHAVIAANRTWAIIHPLSYRARHSTRWSMISCFAVWLGTFVVHGLHPIMSRLLGPVARDPPSTTCLESLRNFPLSTQVTSALGFMLPVSVILLAFPVILMAACRRHSERRRLFRRKSSILPVSTMALTADGKNVAEGRKKRASEKYLLLSLLTASVVVCNLPYFSYYMVQSRFRSIKIPPSVPAVSNLLYQSQAFFDVMLFLMSMRDLRMELWKCLKWTVCR